MDVRCERCKAQYVFDDDQVTPSGLAVQCTNCGHLFRVKKKELVVTVPVKPGDIDGAPVPADSLTGAYRLKAAAAPPPEPREWRVRQVGGNVLAFRELTTLQKWIVEGKVGREDQLSSGGDAWARLGDIEELATFFDIVDRARVAPAPAPPNAGRTMPLYPRAPDPAAAPMPPPAADGGRAAPAQPAPRASAPAMAHRSPAVTPARARQAPPAQPAPAPRNAGARMAVLVAALAIAAGAAAYVYAPQLLRRREETVTITLETIRPPTAEPAGGASPNPDPTGNTTVTPPPAITAQEEAGVRTGTETGTETGKKQDREEAGAGTGKKTEEAEHSAAKEPEPKPVTKVAVAKGPKALVAQAERLRSRGEVTRALDLYGRAIGDDPENVPALTGRGLCYLDLSRYAPAAASFEAALALAPDDADALLGLAEAYRAQGRDADAVRYYERYLAKHPDGDEAAVAQNALQELRR